MTCAVSLVTGASSGIGRAVAARLAADGHHVVAAARRTDRLAELAAEVAKSRSAGSVEPCLLDVTDREATRSVIDGVIARHGHLDVVIANAGVMPLSPLAAGLVDEWDHMIDVNVRGLLHVIAGALPHLVRQDSGHFVTIASIAAHRVIPTGAVYSGTKYAAWAITEGLRLESPPTIRVTTISPGVVDSELASTITDSSTRALMAEHRQHAISSEHPAAAVAFALEQPPEVDVNEVVVRPTGGR